MKITDVFWESTLGEAVQEQFCKGCPASSTFDDVWRTCPADGDIFCSQCINHRTADDIDTILLKAAADIAWELDLIKSDNAIGTDPIDLVKEESAV